MQRTMSNNLCGVPMKRSIRGKRHIHPRRSAYLRRIWSIRGCSRMNPCMKPQYIIVSQMWRYGIQVDGSPSAVPKRAKSSPPLCECLWLFEYKPSTSAEGARSEKTGNQIHKDSCPDLGCSGDLSSVVVHPVNVGTSCFGHKTGLAAVDVKHEGRSSRSSRSEGKPRTGRRTTANCKVPKEIGREVG